MSKLLNRFLRYVKIDTQSEEGVADRFPSTEKQLDLARLLAGELEELGLQEIDMDAHGYVSATLPAGKGNETVPVIGFFAHLDTSPEVSGTNVMPVVHRNYQGGDIRLPGDPAQVIREAENPDLRELHGHDIITSDGTTLLGADNKAGIAEIMTMLDYFCSHPRTARGKIRVCFMPDEEVGNGTKYFDVKNFGAEAGYTVDGERVGNIENENFNASLAVFVIEGVNLHPGYAKNKLVNSVRIAAEIIQRINTLAAPETTEGREGYFHPYSIEGGVSRTQLKILLRDFELSGIEEKIETLHAVREEVRRHYPRSKIFLDVTESYRNMRFKLEEKPEVVQRALAACSRAGVDPRIHIIRGGTDGAKLCFMGLPTPNIFTGGHNFHSKVEWISLQQMETTVKVLINLVDVWRRSE